MEAKNKEGIVIADYLLQSLSFLPPPPHKRVHTLSIVRTLVAASRSVYFPRLIMLSTMSPPSHSYMTRWTYTLRGDNTNGPNMAVGHGHMVVTTMHTTRLTD